MLPLNAVISKLSHQNNHVKMPFSVSDKGNGWQEKRSKKTASASQTQSHRGRKGVEQATFLLPGIAAIGIAEEWMGSRAQ